MAEKIYLIYDKECPLCENYCRAIRINQQLGELLLVDARKKSPLLDEITQQGIDIDQGMVLKIGAHLYYASDAIHALSLISSRHGLFNRFNYWVFKSPTTSRILYPVLRSFRNFLLKMMSKSKINHPNKTPDDNF